MKHRCDCPKPKYQVNGKDLPEEWQRKLGTILHFKVADRFCEICGKPLCGDCGVFTYDNFNREEITCTEHTVCYTCKELEL